MPAAISFDDQDRAAARTLIDLALREDLADVGDLTCQALISPEKQAAVNVVARKPGVLAGEPIGQMVFAQLSDRVAWRATRFDGEELHPGAVIATVTGPLHHLLIGERTMLNFLTHLSGIATLTRRFVDAVSGTNAVVLDTRKTHPGYRRLEKYAVRCGGGVNHRMGLYDGVLIKDNHLAAWTESASIAEAVRTARRKTRPGLPIEVEVDSLEQLQEALAGEPEIVLLDNMSPELLRAAVALRDTRFPPGSPRRPLLEASGGVNFDTIRAIAETGVERISIGALTHSAPALDLAFDWSGSL